MAEHATAVDLGRPHADDFSEHQQTYLSFLKLTKRGVIAAVILLILMAFFLA